MLVLKPRLVLTMSNLGILKDVYVGIEDGYIRYIGKKRPDDCVDLIVLPDVIMLPTFINSHTHVAMTILRGLKDDVNLSDWLMKYILPAEKLLKPREVYYGAIYGIAEMIKSGTTTFLDMYYHELEIAKAIYDSGIRGVVSYGSADMFFDRQPEEEFKILKKFKEDLEAFISKKKASDRIFFAYGPHSPYGCSKELLELVRDDSQETGYRIHIHLSETQWEVKEIKRRFGMTPIEYLNSINFLSNRVMAAHVVWVTQGDIQILKNANVNVLHNPTSNLKLASGIAPVPDMLNRGINVSLATDGPASNNRLDMWKEVHLVSLIHKGVKLDPTVIPAKTALKMATINGAKALGLGDLLGSIEIGKYADFMLVDLNSMLESTPIHDLYSMIVYALDSRSIDSVWVAGKLIYSKSEGFKTIDILKIREKIADIRQRIENELPSVRR